MTSAPLRLCALALGALATSFAASACGPSLRRVHQGNVYFERCYAADLDTLVPAQERRACWQAWHAHYQAGASPERVDHATERLAMLDPAQAEAIALATGNDLITPSTEPDEAALVQIVSAEGEGTNDHAEDDAAASDVEGDPTDAVVPVPASTEERPDGTVVADPDPGPDATLVEDLPTHEEITDAEEHARAIERRSHRAIVAPRSTTPHCARTCQPSWETCIGHCTADERGCLGACRRELTICSRGCY